MSAETRTIANLREDVADLRAKLAAARAEAQQLRRENARLGETIAKLTMDAFILATETKRLRSELEAAEQRIKEEHAAALDVWVSLETAEQQLREAKAELDYVHQEWIDPDNLHAP